MAMLYNYLKSRQTLKLNNSFKIHIKVLSTRHANDLEQNTRSTFHRKMYH